MCCDQEPIKFDGLLVVTQCAADIRVVWLVYLLVYVRTYCVPITTLNQNKQNSITLFGRRPNN